MPASQAQGVTPQSPPSVFHRPVFLCGGQVSGESGYVASEGFPNLYPPNKECVWTVTVRSPNSPHPHTICSSMSEAWGQAARGLAKGPPCPLAWPPSSV